MPLLSVHGWYDENWLYRIPISVDVGGAGGVDGEISIPQHWDFFWDTVRSDGLDMHLTEADGITPLSNAQGNCTGWSRAAAGGAAFNYAAKIGGVRLDGAQVGGTSPFTGSTQGLFYLYFGYASCTVDQVAGFGGLLKTFTRTFRVNNISPRHASPRVVTRPEAAGDTRPRQRIGFTSNETAYIYWDFSRELHRRGSLSEGKLLGEALESCTVSDERAGSPSAISTTANIVFLNHAICRTIISGGTSGLDYTVKLVATTTSGRVLERRVIAQCYDPVET